MSSPIAFSRLTRVDVVGANQLALTMNAVSHGARVSLCALADHVDDPAILARDAVVVRSARVGSDLRSLAERVKIITSDHELVDLELLHSFHEYRTLF